MGDDDMTEIAENVVQLPDRAARSWPSVAEGLSIYLVETGRDPSMVAAVMDELRPAYIAAWEGPVIHAGTDPDEAVNQVNAWATCFLIRLLMMTADAKLDLREACEGKPIDLGRV